MKKQRIRSLAPISREEAEGYMADLAAAACEERGHRAEMDARTLAIKAEYEEALATCAEVIKTRTELLRAWAEQNPEEFAKRKSAELETGVVGFRTGTPKLKTLPGWTFARVLERLVELGERLFVREKVELDKEGIIAAKARGELAGEDLRAMGVDVVQEEAFYVEPDLAKVEGRITVGGDDERLNRSCSPTRARRWPWRAARPHRRKTRAARRTPESKGPAPDPVPLERQHRQGGCADTLPQRVRGRCRRRKGRRCRRSRGDRRIAPCRPRSKRATNLR
jgi:phage host-nuclease inhibitor protein Gam